MNPLTWKRLPAASSKPIRFPLNASAKLNHQTYFRSIWTERAFAEDQILNRLFVRWFREWQLSNRELPLADSMSPWQGHWIWPHTDNLDMINAARRAASTPRIRAVHAARQLRRAERAALEAAYDLGSVNTGTDYECFVANILTAANIPVVRVGQSGDYGADLLANTAKIATLL